MEPPQAQSLFETALSWGGLGVLTFALGFISWILFKRLSKNEERQEERHEKLVAGMQASLDKAREEAVASEERHRQEIQAMANRQITMSESYAREYHKLAEKATEVLGALSRRINSRGR